MCIRPFARFGFSGAQLLLVYFQSNPYGRPFIVKINSAKKIRAEVEACEKARVHFPDDTMVIIEKELGAHTAEAMGAVCYLHVAAHHHDQLKRVKELKELAFAVGEKSSKHKCIKGLDALYKRIAEAHGKCEQVSINIAQEYQRPHDYLRLAGNKTRRRQGTRNLLQWAMGANLKREKCNLFGALAYNPSIILDRLLRLEMSAHVGPIHGDLHTSNVVFPPVGEPRLVDFAWANAKGHILKDFVLMENSIRFMIFPGNVIHEKELDIDRMMVAEDGGAKLVEMASGNGWADQHCNRMGQMIVVIREAAKRAIGRNWNFTEYLTAQFLVLIGALGHYDYNFRESVRTLGLIAYELKERGI